MKNEDPEEFESKVEKGIISVMGLIALNQLLEKLAGKFNFFVCLFIHFIRASTDRQHRQNYKACKALHLQEALSLCLL